VPKPGEQLQFPLPANARLKLERAGITIHSGLGFRPDCTNSDVISDLTRT